MNNFVPVNSRFLHQRIIKLTLFFCILFSIVLLELWYLQIIDGGKMRQFSENNRIRIRYEIAPRGIFFDRHEIPLIENRPSFTLSIIPRELDTSNGIEDKISNILRIPREEVADKLEKARPDSFLPVRIKRDLTIEEVAKIEERKTDLPGVVVEIEPQRAYIVGKFAPHLLGYVREINEEQLKKAERGIYRIGDLVGQTGLEKAYDIFLKGIDGGEQIEVDAMGRKVKTLRKKPSLSGAHVFTTIDRRFQEAADRAMEGKSGAVIVMDPRNGDILAMVSKPAFDLSSFSGRMTKNDWLKLVNNPKKPLLNRATQSQFAPGSIFKIVLITAALEEGVINPSQRFRCNGEFEIGKWNYKCWKEGGHGELNLYEAVKNSCNVYFYNLGLKLGINLIEKYAKKYGFGAPTQISFLGEEKGFVPSSHWKKSSGKGSWYPGDTVITSIGQGNLLVTPIQMVRFISTVANGGILYRPRIFSRITSHEGEILKEDQGEVVANLDLKPGTVEFLRRSLWAVVNEGGTGQAARIHGLDVGGKTATAQTVPSRDGEQEGRINKGKFRDHAWFVGFAPAFNPEIAIVVFVEFGGGGGAVAAPIAKGIVDSVYHKEVVLLEGR